MQITISNPTVLNEFEFKPDNFDVFHSAVGDTIFSRNVSYHQWPNTKVKANGKVVGLGEDPRAFDLFGIPACYAVRFNEQERFVPQLFMQSEDSWDCIKIQMGNNISPGKNWSPFTYNGDVYFVHEMSPFRVLKLSGDVASEAFTCAIPADIMPIDNYPSLRGGSNGLDLGNGLVLGFGHDNYASNARDINTIRHRPFGWCVDMEQQTVNIINTTFEWDNKYSIIDPTAFIKKGDEYFLMTCETELQWKQSTQTGRNCLYPIKIN